MGKRKTKNIEDSWINVDEEGKEEDSLRQSSLSNIPNKESTSSLKPLKSIQETIQKGSDNIWASDFIMPFLDKESPSPKKEPTTSQIRRRRKPATQPIKGAQDPDTSSSQRLLDRAVKLTWSVLGYAMTVLGGALSVMKGPLSYLLAAYMLIGLLTITKNALTSTISLALTPVCRVPGVSFLAPSLCGSPVQLDFDGPNMPQPEFDELMNVQNKFEDLLEQTGDDYAIPAFMKQSQLAMRDVREVVRYSHLRSQNELVFEFNRFIDAASQASWDLETFNSHVGRTVDKVLLTARWTQRALDDIAGPNTTRSAIVAFFGSVLAPFQPIKFTEDVILDQYIKHSDAVQGEISDLLNEAQAVFALLRSLEESVDTIHGVAVRETQYAAASRDEILALLWTKLGGNSKQVNKFDRDLKTLRQISIYGQTAYKNIAATILKLQSMSAEIDQLKERLSSVDPIPGRPQIPLSVHLENIHMGVQRLEDARTQTRDRRIGYSRQIMDKTRGAYGDPSEPLLLRQNEQRGLPKG